MWLIWWAEGWWAVSEVQGYFQLDWVVFKTASRVKRRQVSISSADCAGTRQQNDRLNCSAKHLSVNPTTTSWLPCICYRKGRDGLAVCCHVLQDNVRRKSAGRNAVQMAWGCKHDRHVCTSSHDCMYETLIYRDLILFSLVMRWSLSTPRLPRIKV